MKWKGFREVSGKECEKLKRLKGIHERMENNVYENGRKRSAEMMKGRKSLDKMCERAILN